MPQQIVQGGEAPIASNASSSLHLYRCACVFGLLESLRSIASRCRTCDTKCTAKGKGPEKLKFPSMPRLMQEWGLS